MEAPARSPPPRSFGRRGGNSSSYAVRNRGDNIWRPRGDRQGRDAGVVEETVVGNREPPNTFFPDRRGGEMRSAEANAERNWRSSRRPAEQDFSELHRQDPSGVTMNARFLSSDSTRQDPPHIHRHLPQMDHMSSQDFRRIEDFNTQDHRTMENLTLQDFRRMDHPPSQDFRTREAHSNRGNSYEDPMSRLGTYGDGRMQWRGGTQVHGGERDLTQVARQQPGQRSAARSHVPVDQTGAMVSLQALEASRGAVEGALQGLSLNRVQADATRGRGRDGNRSREAYTSRGRWRENPASSRTPRKEVLSGDAQRMQTVVSSNSIQAVLKEKTNVPQLVQELEEKLTRGQVECMICYEMVKREAAIWSCGSCYSMFHISCIRKWARAPNSADFSISASSHATVGNWRCPGCQSPQFINSDELRYKCFCAQVLEPQVDYYITPHSCGGPCRKPLNQGKNTHCKHSCTMQCHPGPCPPCSALAAPQSCPCGKTSYTRRCSELKATISCGQPCGHQLQCGRHYCAKICHEDTCGHCDAIVTAKCFCGRKAEAMVCGNMDLQGDLDWQKGVFSCESSCLNKLSCERHLCNKKCHPGQCGDCELSPWKIQTCPCGKKSIHELLENGKQRKSCADPVPLCGQGCEKLLPCGKHVCRSLCHAGPCPPCNVLVDQKCRCESSSQTVPCYKTLALKVGDMRIADGVENDDGLFSCNRKCGKKKNCGRHRCNIKCCPLANDDSALQVGEDDPHFCSLPCGKKLQCGQHTCQELCHNGHCPPCLESIFTELSCACGKTSIPPPVPCGTPPPSCQHPCSVSQPCGHRATHTCHFGECPPCTVPSAKECVGNHVILRNVPCGSRDIKCNKLCGKTRQCGLHACARTCHLPPCDIPSAAGEPGTASKSCGQECGAPRRDCQHICVAPCHPSTPCPETRCKFPVTITCSCGRLSAEVPCGAGEPGKGNDLAEADVIRKLPAPFQQVEGKTRVPFGQRKLACDDECAKLEKKRVLADAFGIVTAAVDPGISTEGIQAGSETLNELVRKEPQWLLAVEERFKYLILGTKSPSSGPIRVHVFCSLPKEKREVVRQLAERWNLPVNAVGREPRRFLTVHVTPKSRAPTARGLIARSPLPLAGQAQAPVFNPAVDMDPRFVVGLFELPRDADISTLVLRFGGECELVWLNDKNALAIFADVGRATTAIRRVDHASVYSGAVRIPQLTSASTVRGWGFSEGTSSAKGTSRRKNNQESSWVADAWGEDWGRSSEQPKSVWHGKGAAITTTRNPWGALEQAEAKLGNVASPVVTTPVVDKATSSRAAGISEVSGIQKDSGKSTATDAADDWEEFIE